MNNVTTSSEKGKASTVAPVKALNVNSLNQKGINVVNSTEVSAIRAIAVPFHGSSLQVVEQNGQPYTPMKPIVEGMGLDWGGQHKKMVANRERWGVSVMEMPSAGGRQQVTAMPLRKLPGWLATIDPGRIKDERVRSTIIVYQNECDDALWQYWNEGAAFNPRAFSVNPADELTQDEQDTLRLLLQSSAEHLPKAQRGKFMMQGWSKLKSHFKVPYREIPRGEFSAAVSIVTRHTVEWDVIEDEPELQYKPLESSKLIVDRAKLIAIWVDLGKLRQRLDGLGVMASDLPPVWWEQHAISQ